MVELADTPSGVPLPIVDDLAIIEKQADAVVGVGVEGVFPRLLGHKIAAPSRGKIIDRTLLDITAIAPMKIGSRIGSNQGW